MNNGTRENAFTAEEKFIQLTLTALQFVILAMKKILTMKKATCRLVSNKKEYSYEMV